MEDQQHGDGWLVGAGRVLPGPAFRPGIAVCYGCVPKRLGAG